MGYMGIMDENTGGYLLTYLIIGKLVKDFRRKAQGK
jgi:hypothetical protein